MDVRQIILDTETTGLSPAEGHRVIEIGCVEMVNRRMTDQVFHQYLQPDREIDEEAVKVHGISAEFLVDKPRFEEVVDEFMGFISGAELIIHNAPFDVGFLDAELARLDSKNRWGRIQDHCRILDSLELARKKHPGQQNNLDALCKRYFIDNSKRTLHGALLDSQILGDVYLAMTGGQVSLGLEGDASADAGLAEKQVDKIRRLEKNRAALKVVRATEQELEQHNAYLDAIDKTAGRCLWRSS